MTYHQNISRYISRLSFSLLLLFACQGIQAQKNVVIEKDSIPLFRGFQLSFDLVGPAMLLIDTTAAEFVMIIITSVIGMYAISAALEGFMLTNLNPLMRIILAAAGLMLIYPGTLTDIIGIVITALIFAVEIPKRKRQKMA